MTDDKNKLMRRLLILEAQVASCQAAAKRVFDLWQTSRAEKNYALADELRAIHSGLISAAPWVVRQINEEDEGKTELVSFRDLPDEEGTEE